MKCKTLAFNFVFNQKLLLMQGILAAIMIHCTAFAEQDIKKTTSLPFDELSAFADAFNRIKSNYVEEIDDKVLLEGAIAGMLASLDPHSSFLTSNAFNDLQSNTKGEYGGLGIEVAPEDGYIKVIAPMDETPAQRAGILSGDIIVKIDNIPIKDLPLDESIEMMRGEIGETVTLSILRTSKDKPVDIVVTRDVIRVNSVAGELLGEGLGYIKVNQFQHRTGSDFRKKVAQLMKENNRAIKGLILDLRNNPGGVLSAAIDISDALIASGTLVSTKGRTLDSKATVSAEPDDILAGAPIVVLINNGSASASEIVAGALQDHKRGLIVGTRSFGKGSVQSLLPIHGDAALKLTTARYYTPSGHSIQGEGISPDIEIRQGKLVSEENNPIYESDLRGTLSNDTKSTSTKGDKTGHHPLVVNDNQVAEAVNLLKGFSVLTLNQTSN